MHWFLWADEGILLIIWVFGLCASGRFTGIENVLGDLRTSYNTGNNVVGNGRCVRDVNEGPVEVTQNGRTSITWLKVHLDYFYVDGAMILTLLAIITQNTFDLLLAA